VGLDSTLSVSESQFALPGYPATVFVSGSGRIQSVVYGAVSAARLAAGVAQLHGT
jgi:hypothetical protein